MRDRVVNAGVIVKSGVVACGVDALAAAARHESGRKRNEKGESAKEGRKRGHARCDARRVPRAKSSEISAIDSRVTRWQTGGYQLVAGDVRDAIELRAAPRRHRARRGVRARHDAPPGHLSGRLSGERRGRPLSAGRAAAPIWRRSERDSVDVVERVQGHDASASAEHRRDRDVREARGTVCENGHQPKPVVRIRGEVLAADEERVG